MMLDMADIIKLQLQLFEGQPGETGFGIHIQPGHPLLNLPLDELEIFEKIFFAVRFTDLGAIMRRPWEYSPSFTCKYRCV
jgi:hypothetical protein